MKDSEEWVDSFLNDAMDGDKKSPIGHILIDFDVGAEIVAPDEIHALTYERKTVSYKDPKDLMADLALGYIAAFFVPGTVSLEAQTDDMWSKEGESKNFSGRILIRSDKIIRIMLIDHEV